MTRQEKHLWYDFLSTYTVKFQRQKIIGNYIVDFYCHSAKLVIELDGSQHYKGNAPEYDAKRAEELGKMSFEVVRISNLDIDRNFEGVCKYIDNIVKAKISNTPSVTASRATSLKREAKA